MKRWFWTSTGISAEENANPFDFRPLIVLKRELSDSHAQPVYLLEIFSVLCRRGLVGSVLAY